ncbi:hypothetical protein D9M69_490240 [compost metagenome]
MWNGAAPSLNDRPATMNTTPNASIMVLTRPDSTTRNTSPRFSEPVAPYIIEMPYSRKLLPVIITIWPPSVNSASM